MDLFTQHIVNLTRRRGEGVGGVDHTASVGFLLTRCRHQPRIRRVMAMMVSSSVLDGEAESRCYILKLQLKNPEDLVEQNQIGLQFHLH